ncbi:MAG: trypsin-like peptidase domain-containing protein [Candidatus Omnitrophota bacterium]
MVDYKIPINDYKKVMVEKIEKAINPFCAPLYFLQSRDADAAKIHNNGTIALINTGLKKIFVTAYHVWDAYQRKKQENSNLILAIGTGNKSPTVLMEEACLIDGDSKLDIAVLSFKNSDFYPEDQKKFYMCSHWPASPPKKDDRVAFIGYPAQFRMPNQPEEGVFSGSLLFDSFVTSVNSFYISSVDEHKERQEILYNDSFKKITDFGGISGAPVYNIKRNNNFELIGFVIETNGGNNEIIKIARADFIKTDGTLEYNKIINI